MPQTGNSAEELAAKAAAGDAQAFEELVVPMGGRLLLCIRHEGGRVLGPAFGDEDVLQQALATAWRKMPSLEYRGPGAFYRWLVAIAQGVIRDRRKYLDAQKRGDEAHLESGASPGGPPIDPADPATSITRRVARREQLARVGGALDGLGDDVRVVVEQHLLHSRSVRDIAEELGISKSTAWDRLDRGMTALRGALGTAS